MSTGGSRRWHGKQRKSPEGSHLCLVAPIARALPKTGSISAITQSAETGDYGRPAADRCCQRLGENFSLEY
jgi:hypothetical protein